MQPKALLKGDANENLTTRLNELGADGWEVVSTSPIAEASNFNMNSKTRGLLFLLRRPADY